MRQMRLPRDLTPRAELAKSLAAYTKNHFQSGSYAVSSSQYPLLPPAPPARALSTSADTETAATDENEETVADASDPLEQEAEKPEEPIVTDVVSEQVGAGESEPAPTPAVGDSPKEELDQPGGIEKADEEIAEVKQEEEGQAKQEEAGETAATGEGRGAATEPEPAAPSAAKPQVEEVVPETEDEVTQQPAAEDQREQKRVENPVYTLEVVGNRYNPSNFW
jgi:hypothetical protein